MEGNPSDAELLKQLNRSNKEHWEELREIAKTLSAGDRNVKYAKPKIRGRLMTLGYPLYTKKVGRAVELLNQIKAVTPMYHWMKQEPPKYIPTEELSPADAIRLATGVIRSERFGEGAIASALKSGLFEAILTALIKWYDVNKKTDQ